MDNEASRSLQELMADNKIDYQLALPQNPSPQGSRMSYTHVLKSSLRGLQQH
jgi:hypothetical protein